MLASALRLISTRVSTRPAVTDPIAYAAAISEKLPAPRPSVSRTNVGTPTIHVPDEIVTATPRTATPVASTGSGLRAAKPSRMRGAAACAALPPRCLTRRSSAAETKNDAALRPKKALIGMKASRPAAAAQPPTESASAVARTSAVRPLDVVPVDERRQQRAVRRVEVARGGGEREGGDDQEPERQVAFQPERRDRHEQRAAEEVGGDHRAPAVEPVGDEAAVEAEGERRDAVGEADGQHAERAAGDERVPHQREVLERVAELARGDRQVHAPKVRPPEQRPGRLPAPCVASLPHRVRG